MDTEAQRQKARADHLEQILYATQRERDTARFQLTKQAAQADKTDQQLRGRIAFLQNRVAELKKVK